METKETPAYYAILTAEVRYDKNLTPNAKLLYAEITALCNQKGYCWSNNSYFAELYNVSTTSVSKWVSQLVKLNYLKTSIIYKDGTKEILHRYLTLVNRGVEEKLNTPIEEKLKDNTTINNTTINTIKKDTEKKVEFNFRKSLLDLGAKEQLVTDWLKVRKSAKATNTKTAFNRFKKEFESCNEDINQILELCIFKNWRGFEKKWLSNLGSSYNSNNTQTTTDDDNR